MSRGAKLGLLFLAVLIAAFVGLWMLSNSSAPPQREVEETVPDEKLPK